MTYEAFNIAILVVRNNHLIFLESRNNFTMKWNKKWWQNMNDNFEPIRTSSKASLDGGK